MKKISTFILAVMAVLMMYMPFSGTAEAARVAIVPIQINETLVERAGDFTTYYWDIMIEKFKYPDFELMDDEKVADVIPDEGLQSFDQATLKEILEKNDAEIIVAMRLDLVSEEPRNLAREPQLHCRMKGEYAAYNRLTGKYYVKKINFDEDIEELLTYKNDWQQDTFASILRRCVNRTIEDKHNKHNRIRYR